MLHEYQAAEKLYNQGFGFNVMVMALVMKADPNNLAKLRLVYPDLVDEVLRRRNMPGGALDADEWRTVVESHGYSIEDMPFPGQPAQN